jgi:hypothetical protein
LAHENERKGFSFHGNHLVGVITYMKGAGHVTIAFDPAFTNCQASVIEVHSNGTIRRTGPDGRICDVTFADNSSERCSIPNGNAFAS